jgi:GTPase SAR1 family protein
MGQCGGKSNLSEEEKLKIQRDQSINKDLAETAQIEAAKIKLLLLGAGESGKSTIFKQMKVIYGKKYTEEEKRYCIPIIFFNIITAMKILCQQAIQQNLLSQVHAMNEFDLIRNLDENSSIDLEVGNAIKCLWEDPGIQEVWKLRSQFHIIESVQYYFNRIDIIKLPDYLPDKDDILYYRIRTSGIVTESYSIDKRIFEMYDVGGQRNERKKWIHCFEDVTAIIFVVALSEYDQQLFEDKSVNRMVRQFPPSPTPSPLLMLLSFSSFTSRHLNSLHNSLPLFSFTFFFLFRRKP